MEIGFLEKHGFRSLAITYKKEVNGHRIKFDKTTRLWYIDEVIRSFEEVKAFMERMNE